ncbi:MAG: M14 family zinc carboxypeptidase [Dehalococcoidia bacterium]
MLLGKGQGMARRGSRDLRAWCAGALVLAALVGGACTFTIGRSVEQRDIGVQRFGSGPRAVLLIGGLHTGAEDNSRMIVEQLAVYLGANPGAVPASVTLYVLPSANPDGTARGIHTNARGIDLNRNWPADDWSSDACHPASGCRRGLGGPAPLSEPETAALYNFVATLRPEITIVWHAEAPLVEANEVPGADVYGQRFAEASGYPYVEEWTAYRITGQLIDALEQRLALRAFDVELANCCQITPEEFDRNLRGLLAVLQEVSGERVATPTAERTPAKPTPTPFRVPDIEVP